MEDLDDDWIIDDIGGQTGEDDAESKNKEKALVKEMGKPRYYLHLFNGRTITPSAMTSEYHKGPTAISARGYTNGTQEAISWYVRVIASLFSV
jgi:hypothetical protein